MLKFKKINKKNNTPFDTSILDGIFDPVLIVDEQELVIDYNKAYKRLLEADPSKNYLNALTNNKNIKKTIKQCLMGNPTPPSEVYLPNPIGLFFDVHIRRLRKALNAWDGPELVRTVRGAGYSLDAALNIN